MTDKKLFWDVFLRLASFVFMKNFRSISPALHVLSKKCQISYHICEKKMSTKIFTVVHQSKKELLDLDQNWAKTRHLLFKTWKSSISMDSPIVLWISFQWDFPLFWFSPHVLAQALSPGGKLNFEGDICKLHSFFPCQPFWGCLLLIHSSAVLTFFCLWNIKPRFPYQKENIGLT